MAQVRINIQNSREAHKAERTRLEAEETKGPPNRGNPKNPSVPGDPDNAASQKGPPRKPPQGKAGRGAGKK
eukprot:6883291-Pyramimonas_sp.AAC.1